MNTNRCRECIYIKGATECSNCVHNKQDNFVSQERLEELYNSFPKIKIKNGDTYFLMAPRIVNGTPIVSYSRRGLMT